MSFYCYICDYTVSMH